MSEASDSVKRYAARLQVLSVANAKNSLGSEFKQMSSGLTDVLRYIKGLEMRTTALPQTFGDLSDLPDELLAELNIAKPDELDNQVVTVVNALGGEATIDQILVGLFRKFKVVQKRRFMQGRLYRMIKNDMLWNVPEKKGTYTTTQTEGGSHVPEDDDPPPKSKPKPRVVEDFSRGGDFDDEIPF